MAKMKRLLATFAGLLCSAFSGVAYAEDGPSEPPVAPVPVFEFRGPLEVGQGVLIGHPRPGGYTGSLKLLPGISVWNRFEVNALFDFLYFRNPGFDFGAGARAQVTVFSVLQNVVAFRLGGQVAHLFRAETQRLGAGVIITAANLVNVGVWPCLDLATPESGGTGTAKQFYLSTALGVNLWALFTDPVGNILRSSSMEDLGHGGQ